MKPVQPSTFSAGERPGSPQSAGPISASSPASTASARSAFGHARRHGLRSPCIDHDPAAPISDGRERMGQGDAGVLEKAAIMAGMAAAFAKLDREVEGQPTSIAERDVGDIRRLAGAVRSQEKIGRKLRLLGSSQNGLSPGEPISSPISIRTLALKPSRPRVSMTCASAAMIRLCWPLLSAVPRPYQRSPSMVIAQGRARPAIVRECRARHRHGHRSRASGRRRPRALSPARTAHPRDRCCRTAR